ncbi:MAG: ATP-binding protein [Planctomycetota bacterium]
MRPPTWLPHACCTGIGLALAGAAGLQAHPGLALTGMVLLLATAIAAAVQLRHHLQRLQHLPVSAGNAWCRLDDAGRIRAFHGDSVRFFGWHHDELLRSAPALADFITEGADPDHLDDRPCAVQRRDQSLIAVHMLACSPGPTPGRWLHLRDITEEVTRQGELLDREAELRLVFNTIEECVLLLGLDGTVTNANTAALERYGASLPGRNVHQALRAVDEPGPDEVLQRCLAEFRPTTQEQHLPAQGRTLAVHVYPIFSKRGSMRQLLYLERDVTSQRMMELEIQVQHRRLQDSLVRLRELDQAKTKWLNSVSHELRTPLTSIRSYSELLLTYPDTDADTREEFVGIIRRECERLTRLINDLLDLAAIENGSMHIHPTTFPLEVLAQETVAALQALAQERRVELLLHGPSAPLTITTDRDRLQQVLVNLLSNAIKFSPPEGSVSLQCWQQEGECHFRVEDEGPGIDPADRRRIFRRFTQLGTDLTDKPTGTGLGLTICGEIMHQLGGLLRCTDPQRLRGACFHGRLPLRPPDPEEQQAQERSTRSFFRSTG